MSDQPEQPKSEAPTPPAPVVVQDDDPIGRVREIVETGQLPPKKAMLHLLGLVHKALNTPPAPAIDAESAAAQRISNLENEVRDLSNELELAKADSAFLADMAAREVGLDVETHKVQGRAVIPHPENYAPRPLGVQVIASHGAPTVWVDGRAVGGYKNRREAIELALALWGAVRELDGEEGVLPKVPVQDDVTTEYAPKT